MLELLREAVATPTLSLICFAIALLYYFETSRSSSKRNDAQKQLDPTELHSPTSTLESPLSQPSLDDKVGSDQWVKQEWQKHVQGRKQQLRTKKLKRGGGYTVKDLEERINKLVEDGKFTPAGSALLDAEVEGVICCKNYTGMQGIPVQSATTGTTGAPGQKGEKGDKGDIRKKGNRGDTGSLFHQVRARYCFSKHYLSQLHDSHGWNVSSSSPSRKVSYKKATDGNNIVVKVGADFPKASPVHLLAHAKECHTCKSWIPFTAHAAKVEDLNESGIEAIVHVCIGVTAIRLARDVLVRFWGDDDLPNGKYTFFAHSVNEGQGVHGWDRSYNSPKPLDIRASIRYAVIEVSVTGADSFRIDMISEIDPNLHLIPDTLVNWALRKIVWVAIGLILGMCQKMFVKETSTEVGKIMQTNAKFYEGILKPKVAQAIANDRSCGYVGGWAIKTVPGKRFTSSKTRRYFVIKPGECILKQYSRGDGVEGTTPMKEIEVVRSLMHERHQSTLVLSEFKGGKTRIVTLEFDVQDIASKINRHLCESSPENVKISNRTSPP